MAAKFGQAFSVDPGWILYGGDGTPRSAPNSSDFGEVLLRTAALSDQEALKLYLALGERFGASVHSGSPGDVPAGNEATAPRHPRKRS